MANVPLRRKVVKTLTKGQITIPNEFREALGIRSETLLDVSLVGDHLEIKPLNQAGPDIRRYTEDDIARFLAEDDLDEGTAAKIRELLTRGDL